VAESDFPGARAPSRADEESPAGVARRFLDADAVARGKGRYVEALRDAGQAEALGEVFDE
jgi:hypothetical protein